MSTAFYIVTFINIINSMSIKKYNLEGRCLDFGLKKCQFFVASIVCKVCSFSPGYFVSFV